MWVGVSSGLDWVVVFADGSGHRGSMMESGDQGYGNLGMLYGAPLRFLANLPSLGGYRVVLRHRFIRMRAGKAS